MKRYMSATRQAEQYWLDILRTNLAGSALLWLNNCELKISQGQRAAFRGWSGFVRELIAAFDHTDKQLVARKSLHALKQTGAISGYIDAFQTIRYQLPDLTSEEAYATFMRGLKEESARPLLMSNVKDIDQLLQLAQQLSATESFLRANDPNRNPRRRGRGGRFGGRRGGGRNSAMKNQGQKPNPKPETPNPNDRNNAMRGRGNGRRNGNDRKPKPNSNETLICVFCKKAGHRVFECPLMKEAAAKFQKEQSRKNK